MNVISDSNNQRFNRWVAPPLRTHTSRVTGLTLVKAYVVLRLNVYVLCSVLGSLLSNVYIFFEFLGRDLDFSVQSPLTITYFATNERKLKYSSSSSSTPDYGLYRCTCSDVLPTDFLHFGR